MNRVLKVTREKKFIGWDVPYYMIIDGKVCSPMENGHQSVHNMNNQSHSFQVGADFKEGRVFSNVCTIPAGDDCYHVNISTKMGLTIGKIYVNIYKL